MSAARPLLVELLVEELPPKALKKLSAAFADVLVRRLEKEGLVAAGAGRSEYATPRRLAVLVDPVAERAADRQVTHKLMPAAVGLTAAGAPTPALTKKLAALGEGADAVAKLERRVDGKSEALFLTAVEPGATLAEALQRALEAALAGLPIPKVMQYQLADGWTTVSFVRPAHRLVALHGADVIAVRALGLRAGRTTQGHRFEAAAATIELRDAAGYAAQLREEGAVIASFDARRAEIDAQLRAAATREGLAPIDDDALRDEVTAIVERPNVLTCRFDDAFLAVPPECLVLTMKANQKYFPLLDAQGRLTSRFLVVSNIRPLDPSNVVAGNERVVRPRLADAKFFFDQDRKRTLASRVAELDRVVYHRELGSQGDRVRRLRRIARWVAGRIGTDADLAERAAELAKADLLTDMVGEFPELQGIMGGYYAEHDGEKPEVVAAIRSQYVHRRSEANAGDAANLVAEALVIADRSEALVGMWGIGMKPTGDKDPYALRRHALTLIQAFEAVGAAAALVGRPMRLDLRELLAETKAAFAVALQPAVVDEVAAFVYERYFHQLASVFDAKTVDAVITDRPPLHETVQRVQAVREFVQLPEAPALAAANKRVVNILRKSDGAAARVDGALLAEPAERALASALGDIGLRADDAYREGDYAGSLRLLASLKPSVDAFFDTVLVNVDAPAVRANRLALLSALRTTMNRVADLSRLAV
ncbi:MAG: glycine--tRNA ligase subunit beta [Rhizobacter sp.]|nr:glycine--tRNA ligase subunit beta [Rhizobacter sp.]